MMTPRPSCKPLGQVLSPSLTPGYPNSAWCGQWAAGSSARGGARGRGGGGPVGGRGTGREEPAPGPRRGRKVKLLEVAGARGAAPGRAPMALSKALRLLRRLEASGESSVLLEARGRRDCLLFEAGTVATLAPEEKEVIKGQYGKLTDAYGCLGELRLKSGGTSLSFLVLVTGCTSVGRIPEAEIYKITATDFYPLQEEAKEEDRLAALRKILNSGVFYFSWPNDGSCFDLTVRAQKQGDDSSEWGNSFFWNQLLHVPLRRHQVNCCDWLLKVICGVVAIRTVYASHKQAKACLISRISCERAGARFHTRGVNDDGHVSNFVETEQTIYMDDGASSFVQIRGSVPLFWEQPGLQDSPCSGLPLLKTKLVIPFVFTMNPQML